MKAATNCHGQKVRDHGDRVKRYYDCTSRSQWRIEWIAEPKVGKPRILHLMTACSAHLVQILQQATATAVGGDVHVLHATECHEWWPELADD